MAQLVKLHDYISRYETDIYRYPSRFVRLKKERWNRFFSDWAMKREHYELDKSLLQLQNEPSIVEERNENIILNKFKQWLPKRKNKSFDKDNSDWFLNIGDDFYQQISNNRSIENKEQLKDIFKEEIFQFQISWASSSITEKSVVKKKYYYDPLLSFMLKELPDSYFIFYEPVIYLKKAPVDFDTIILTPSEMWLISNLFGSQDTIYQSFSENYWKKLHKGSEEKILHPSVMIRRMRSVIEHILLENELSFPIRTAIVAKDSYIDIPQANQQIKLIDRRNFPHWHERLVRNVAPIKHQQLKIADALFKQSLTVSIPRNVNIGEQEIFD